MPASVSTAPVHPRPGIGIVTGRPSPGMCGVNSNAKHAMSKTVAATCRPGLGTSELRLLVK
jgi:hypothetical protein